MSGNFSALVPVDDNIRMPISVHVREHTGGLVAEPSQPVDINRLCHAAAADPDQYPLLSGIDEYDDTIFNLIQSRRLVLELKALSADSRDSELQAAAAAVLALASLLEPAPGRPHHRQLFFIGD
jgi:hypothetical protein